MCDFTVHNNCFPNILVIGKYYLNMPYNLTTMNRRALSYSIALFHGRRTPFASLVSSTKVLAG